MTKTKLVAVIAFAIAFVLGACGPSNQEISRAKQARYRGDKLVLFNSAKTATENKHKIEVADETKLGLKTVMRWYSFDGTPVAANNVQNMPDRALGVSHIVELLPESDNWVVSVRPVVFRYNRGMAVPEPVPERDFALPGYVQGQVDQLQFAIYEALKSYEVKTVGGIAPAPTAPAAEPAPAPADPSGAPTEPAPAPADPSAPTP